MRSLGVSLVVAALLAIVGLGWGIDFVFDRYAAPVPDDGLAGYRATGAALARTLDDGDEAAAFVSRWNARGDAAPALALQRYDEFALPPALRAEFERGTPLELESADRLTLNFLLPRTQQVLSLAVPTLHDELPAGPSLAWTLLFYGGVLSLLLLWLLPLLRRLSHLRAAARAIGDGALERRIEVRATSYIADIEREFNRMAQRIQTLIEDNKLLGSAVSHDLRTPLARLRFGIDALGETDDPVLRERYQQRISADVQAMEALVEMLLAYASLEASILAQKRAPLALDVLVAERIGHCATERRVEWTAPASECTLDGDRRFLAMLVDNLLNNALRHARSRVVVGVAAEGDGCVLSVEDDGSGIAPGQRAEVLKPFVRGAADTRPGYGLGLAIVARVAEWHGAAIDIDRSAALGGAALRVRFPRASPSPGG